MYSNLLGCFRIYLSLCVLICLHNNIYLHFNWRQGQIYWKEHWVEIKEITFLILVLEIISQTRGNLLISLGFNILIKINWLRCWTSSLLCLHLCPRWSHPFITALIISKCIIPIQNIFFPQIQFCVFNLLLIIACNWTSIRTSRF